MNTIKNFLVEAYTVSFTVLLTLVFAVFGLTISALGKSIALQEGETAEGLLERTRAVMQELINLGEAG